VKFLKFAAGVAFLGFPSLAIAASVALYAGTFDPPSRAQIAVLRCALAIRACLKPATASGKQISRLVVLLNESSEEDPLASTRERILMVRKALRHCGERVEVSASTAAEMDAKRRSLLADKNIDQVIHFIGQDSFNQSKSSPDSHNPSLHDRRWALCVSGHAVRI
jgi:nicotinic acid mononucleotide adenylyltransferase